MAGGGVSTSVAPVTRSITGHLLSGDIPFRSAQRVPIVLTWAPRNPLVVTLSFPNAYGGPVCWHVGRELLAAGLLGPAGLGDVTLLPDLVSAARLELILSSPTGRIGFRVPRATLVAFLKSTWRVVPAGAETMPAEWPAEVTPW